MRGPGASLDFPVHHCQLCQSCTRVQLPRTAGGRESRLMKVARLERQILGHWGTLGWKWTKRKPCSDKAATSFFCCLTEKKKIMLREGLCLIIEGGQGTMNMESKLTGSLGGHVQLHRPQGTEAGICSDTANDIPIRLNKRFHKDAVGAHSNRLKRRSNTAKGCTYRSLKFFSDARAHFETYFAFICHPRWHEKGESGGLEWAG